MLRGMGKRTLVDVEWVAGEEEKGAVVRITTPVPVVSITPVPVPVPMGRKVVEVPLYQDAVVFIG